MNITYLDTIDSTNDWLKNRHCSSDMDVVVAEEQTRGRGSGTNTWESERGKNLTFSILIRSTDIMPAQQFIISMMISNAIVSAVCQHIDSNSVKVSIKWPNDIYLNDRKVCGILIENTVRGMRIAESIIGVGLNVNQRTFVSDAPNPCSLAQYTGIELDRSRLLHAVLDNFQSELQRHAHGQMTTIRTDYKNHLYRKEGLWKFADETGDFAAHILDVMDDGHLILSTPNGEKRTYDFHQVKFVI